VRLALAITFTLLVGCTPIPADKEITLTARELETGQVLQCPPICLQVEKPKDAAIPLAFTVCSAATGCFSLESGKSAKVSSPVTLTAPDGTSSGQVMATFEEGVFLKFHSWEDKSKTNPRQITLTAPSMDLSAYFAVWEPKPITTSASQAGCKPSPIGAFVGTFLAFPPAAPFMLDWANWVEISRGYQTVSGPVTAGHIAGEDFFGSHLTQDYNFWLLLSGENAISMLSQNKNGQYGERPNQFVVEWEEGSYPRWAWPYPSATAAKLDKPKPSDILDGDLAWVTGKHIYDCGHQEDYILQGAWTEIHPPIGTAVMRGIHGGKLFLKLDDTANELTDLNPRATGIEGVQVDIWFNGDGGAAVETLQHKVPGTPFDIRGKYEIQVPLPPPPQPLYPEAKFKVYFSRLLPSQPQPMVTPHFTPSGGTLDITLDLSNYDDTWQTCKQQTQFGEKLSNCRGAAYGVRIKAGWERFDYPPDLRRVQVTLGDVKIYDDYEGEDGDGEFKMWLDVGPAAALGQGEVSVALHDINTGLGDAAGNGESYSLVKNGNLLTYVLNIRENIPESNYLQLYLHGYEDDPIWDDAFNKLEREFRKTTTTWKPSNGYPKWAVGCYSGGGPVLPGTPACEYGNEKSFGTERTNTQQPIPYDDHVWGDCNVPCWGYSLSYRIEELKLP